MKVFALALLLAVSPAAANASDSLGAAEDHVDRALEEVMSALKFVLRAIPQYELPEVMPNGDIIIRRVPADDPRKPEPDETQKPEESEGGIRT